MTKPAPRQSPGAGFVVSGSTAVSAARQQNAMAPDQDCPGAANT